MFVGRFPFPHESVLVPIHFLLQINYLNFFTYPPFSLRAERDCEDPNKIVLGSNSYKRPKRGVGCREKKDNYFHKNRKENFNKSVYVFKIVKINCMKYVIQNLRIGRDRGLLYRFTEIFT